MIRIKNEKQIDGIRKSCKALARLYQALIPRVREGISTGELDKFCVDFIKSIGGIPAWYSQNFPGAACISVNDEVIHGIPSAKRIIKNGDFVSIDIGIDLGGYISDSAVTVPVGPVSPEKQKLLSVTADCLKAGIEACRAGNRISDISRAVFDIADAAGFGVVHEYCGHGVGLKVHEDPQIPNVPSRGGPNPRIVPGMVLAIEPMINMGTGDVDLLDDDWTVVTADGSVSCHMEHTVAVFPDHTEVLTVLNPGEA
ncbi:type I methionyl aminopeptidase [Brucepastera parasyntrophica]|uniref:type I methionyl aminopeptidase n=1 Tax=Brucepastera parasyntrophica TaxID=2880008 RepID=UPI00210C5845|nr:type I methionyl aminopeptidase [Brucepastera parasyntrophica]ULQ60346.1 type I methionyl aminopeptidase [Brucepastera parasyntrophica]